MDLPALFMPAPFGIGRAPVGAGAKGGPLCIDAADGTRSPLLGVPGVLVGLAISPVLFLLFRMGKAGRELAGGSLGPRSRGSVVAMMVKNPEIRSTQVCDFAKVRYAIHVSMGALTLIVELRETDCRSAERRAQAQEIGTKYDSWASNHSLESNRDSHKLESVAFDRQLSIVEGPNARGRGADWLVVDNIR